MAYLPTPQQTTGGETQAVVSDINVSRLLELVLSELRSMNFHMALITDEEIKADDIQGE